VATLFFVAAAAAVCAGLDSDSAEVVVDVQTSLVGFRLAEGSGPAEIALGVPIDALDIHGAARFRFHETTLEAADGAALSGAGMGMLRGMTLPESALVTLRVDAGVLSIAVNPGEGHTVVHLSAAPAWTVSLGGEDETDVPMGGPSDAPVSLSITAAKSFVMTARLGDDGPHTFGVQGVPAVALEVADPPVPGEPIGVSRLQTGRIDFPAIKGRQERLWFAERIQGEMTAGRWLLLEFLPAATAATELGSRHARLHAVWQGTVHDLRVGYPGAMRSVMPSKLTSKVANRDVADYFALVTVVLIFVGVLLGKSSPDELKAPPDV
jgi:hypothetical protein